MLEIRLLGQFDVRRDGTPVDIPSRPAQSLLAYLALHPGTPQRREKLAGLFWPDAAEANARSNLRAALWRIRKSLEGGPPAEPGYLLVDEIALAFDPRADFWLDAAALERRLDEGASAAELVEVVSVYRGELLPGFYDEWVVLERERLQALFEHKMKRLLDRLVAEQRWSEALELGERWIALGHTPEPAYRALMAAHAGLGDLSSVAAAFQRCAEALWRELGVEPSEETRAQYEGLTRAERSAHASVSAARPSAATPAVRLPVPATPFVGREQELVEVGRILDDPDCQMLTLVGPGGIGKTRMALQAAARQAQAGAYPDGVCFVPLAPLNSAQFIVSAMASALQFAFYGSADPKEQLFNHLRHKAALLVMDNFEHLLAAGASAESGTELLSELVAFAPRLKLLVTSRERLNLQGEWLYELDGLDCPESERADGAESFGAVQFFAHSARRIRPNFVLSPATLPGVVRICRLAGGLPLAIELAAAWVRALSCDGIAAEMERQLDFLSSSMRDLPKRHHSLRAAFDHSWKLLSDDERRAFRRLSVFRGGCERQAAEQVAGASLALLSALTDKSLVRRSDAGRFELHELLRQYAHEKLSEAGETEAVHRWHRDWFLRLAEEAELGLQGREQLNWLRRLEAERGNVRAALEWCMQTREAEPALRLAACMAGFWWRRSYLTEAREWLDRVLALGAGAPASTRWKALFWAGLIRGDLGDRKQALALAEQSLSLSRQAGDPLGLAYSIALMGYQTHFAGDHERAEALLEQSLIRFREIGHQWGSAWTLLFLADARMRQGKIEVAAALWEDCLVLSRELGDVWCIAFALGGLGDTARMQGDYRRAAELLREGLSLQLEHGNRMDATFALEALAILAAAQQQPRKAARLWGAAEALRKAINAPLPAAYQRDYEPYLAEARAELGEAAYAAAWAEGRAMPLEQALAVFDEQEAPTDKE